MPEPNETTVGAYLVRRLEQIGLAHIFGVPGDYVLTFFDLLEASSIAVVTTCNELNAGYATDAYARMAGVGAMCVTYGVGGFSAYNAVAGAFAERVPVVVVSGGPRRALRESLHPHLLHHTIGDMRLQHRIFEHVTQAAVVLTSPDRAPRHIDETLAACLKYSRPVYIEIPADMVSAPCHGVGPWAPDLSLHVDPEVLQEAVAETQALIKSSDQTVILAGAEAYRLGLADALRSFVAHAGYPVATTALGKGLISERDSNFIGTYTGALANEPTRQAVEEADLLLCLGAWMTDLNLGNYTARLDPSRMIVANSERVRVRHHVYEHIPLESFLSALREALPRGAHAAQSRSKNADLAARAQSNFASPHATHYAADYIPIADAKLTADRFWARLGRFLEDGEVLIADTGSCTFMSLLLSLPDQSVYLSNSFYTSMGYAIPAALGAKLAAPNRRPVVLVGDGAFQMTGQELSTIIRHKMNPIVILLNNDGYQIERVIYDNRYNDIQMWDYSGIPQVFGGRRGMRATTEGELEEALATARANPDSLAFIEACIDKLDFSAPLRRAGEALR